jgi:sterol desaturase/sphingolipid hydroxylase (fatty acid hydroxylase superfamily)
LLGFTAAGVDYLWLNMKKIIFPVAIVTVTFLVECLTRDVTRRKRDYLVIFLVQASFLLIYFLIASLLDRWIHIPDYLVWRPAKAPGLGVFLLMAIVYIFAFDVLLYWSHRAFHAVPALWKFHAVHHRTHDLDAMHNFVHPVELTFRYFAVVIPLGLLTSFNPTTSVLVAAVLMVQNQMNHMNSPINLGIFGRILVDNRFHFIHHSREDDDFNRNFANIFNFTDRLFGTYRVPKLDGLPETGLPGGEKPFSFLDFLLARRTEGSEPPAAAVAQQTAP